MNVKPILFLVGLFCSTGGGAVTVLQMTLAQALSGSELVFEGRVIGQQVGSVLDVDINHHNQLIY